MPIIQKLHAIMGETGYVQKSSKNEAQHYKYASEAAFIAHIRPSMVKAGVICYPVGLDQHIGKTPSESQVLVQGSATFRFQDTEDSSYIDIVVPFSGADSTDKAAYKAMTGARKYALRQALLVETGDDPEKDTGDPSFASEVTASRDKAMREQMAINPAVKAYAKQKAVEQAFQKAVEDSGAVGATVENNWQTHGQVLVKNITPVEAAAYAEQLSRLGVTNAEACKILGIKSMKADRPDSTLAAIVSEVAAMVAKVNAAKEAIRG